MPCCRRPGRGAADPARRSRCGGSIAARSMSPTSTSSPTPPPMSAEQMTLTDSCYLIRNGDRYLLWDTGLPGELAGQRRGGDGPIRMSLRERVRDQLARIGVQPGQVTFVGISHYHDDHTGQAADFPGATLLVGAARLGGDPRPSARRRRGSGRGPKGSRASQPLRGDHDVFGDGSVIMLNMPGHTPGHRALLVRLPRTGPVLLTGDLYHFTENMRDRRRADLQHQPRRHAGLDGPLPGDRPQPARPDRHPARAGRHPPAAGLPAVGAMRALLSEAPGGPETLRLTELPDPVAGPGQLLVAVKACAINYPDVLIIEDKYQFKPPRPVRAGRRDRRRGRGGGRGRDRLVAGRPGDRDARPWRACGEGAGRRGDGAAAAGRAELRGRLGADPDLCDDDPRAARSGQAQGRRDPARARRGGRRRAWRRSSSARPMARG